MNGLTLADEFVVLVLDDDTGEIDGGYLPVINTAIAAGLLMELALIGRIDTDLTRLFLIDGSATGDDMLNEVLADVAAAPETHSSAWWIDRIAINYEDLAGRILSRLVRAGILREEERNILWVFSHRAYPQTTGREEREAKGRLLALLANDDVPDPRDTLLLGLAHATGVLGQMLTPQEMEACGPRIAQVVALEEIGRSTSAIATEIWDAVIAGAVT